MLSLNGSIFGFQYDNYPIQSDFLLLFVCFFCHFSFRLNQNPFIFFSHHILPRHYSLEMSAQFAGITVSSDDPATRFDFEAKVGEGSYGAVYKARDRITGMEVAVKVLDLQGDDAQAADLKREINILQSCSCKQIVAYGGAFVKDGQLWISMEYCGAGSLSDLMAICDTTLGEREIAGVMYQSLLGLDYLHSQKKIHRDIKSGNILLTDDGLCKLADFGVSAELSTTLAKAKTMIGTPYFMAPEVLMNLEYDNRADIWSMGITAYELACGQPPLADVHPMRAIFQIPNSPPPRLPEEYGFSPQFCQFIECCLQKDPKSRLTAKELLRLPFFKEVSTEQQSIRIVNELLDRCKESIEQWRVLDAQEQQQLGQNIPGAPQQQQQDDSSGTVAINSHHLQTGEFDGFGQSTIRRTDVSDAQQLRYESDSKNPGPSYNNDGTVLIKQASPRAVAPAKPQQQSQEWDLGTVRVTKPSAPQQGTTHFGSLKANKNQSGTVVFNSGTIVTRPQGLPQQQAAGIPNLNTVSSQNLVKNLTEHSTNADIQRAKQQLEQYRNQDLQNITNYYEQRLKELDTLRKK